jgi:Zn-dependent protease with chaperone function
MTIDPLFDVRVETPAISIWQKVKAFWRSLQLTHPPVSERVAVLEKMNGSACALPKV